jgi:5'-methylthioinosine phosphorylase
MKIGIIGGSGLNTIKNLEVTHREMVNTPYGSPSSPAMFGKLCGGEVIFLPRHGIGHTIPPHKINYRANIAALKELGITHIISIAAVGGITPAMSPVRLVFPDQIIDYTYSRKHTFFEGEDSGVVHTDFSYPYDEELRGILKSSADGLKLANESIATYGATQGPRLETVAEIARMESDGCDIVGMTGMPEASLAHELGMRYAHCTIVVNWAAGKGDGSIVSMEEIESNLKLGSKSVHQLLSEALPKLL